ncbi:hypothetical protein SCHPADRAFT_899957 [Schizopora paradoxa]|uniref:DUF6534 domain-containing protein n=1 Tax=Schizopora paradoxa TaxID=27342 RepID=A0A0H2S2R1_9AGAM|nr:hypothetical protein SCHPADRAFT_899957 [Schizopora paradoxa]
MANYGTTVGSLLVASWFATLLTGIVLFQAYLFFRNRPHGDKVVYAWLVVILCILDCAHVVNMMAAVYFYLVSGIVHTNNLSVLTPTLAITVALTAFITFIVQSFFTWRVWRLSTLSQSRSYVFVAPLLGLILSARLACGWAVSIKSIQYGTFTAFVAHLRWIFTAGVVLAVVADVIITISLWVWLNSSKSGIKSSDAVVDKIQLYTVETGTLTSVTSIATLIFALATPDNLIFIALHFVISKMYINSFLASLNTRNIFRAERRVIGDTTATKFTSDVMLSTIQFDPRSIASATQVASSIVI